MNAKYAYLLWRYNEEGPYDMKITLNRSAVVDLLKSYNLSELIQYSETDPLLLLQSLLLKDDKYLATVPEDGQHGLTDGWGGLVFQVLKIDGEGEGGKEGENKRETGATTEFSNRTLNLLNCILEKDPAALRAILLNQVPVNRKLDKSWLIPTKNPYIKTTGKEPNRVTSALGLINAILSTNKLPVVVVDYCETDDGCRYMTGFSLRSEWYHYGKCDE